MGASQNARSDSLVSNTWTVTFNATELDARAQICATRDALLANAVDTGSVGSIELALAEAINNIVEHAYAGQPIGTIELGCSLCPTHLAISLRDAGKAIPGGVLPDGKEQDVNVPIPDLPEGGFGWFLIRQLTTSLAYRRNGEFNELDLGFELPIPAP